MRAARKKIQDFPAGFRYHDPRHYSPVSSSPATEQDSGDLAAAQVTAGLAVRRRSRDDRMRWPWLAHGYGRWPNVQSLQRWSRECGPTAVTTRYAVPGDHPGDQHRGHRDDYGQANRRPGAGTYSHTAWPA